MYIFSYHLQFLRYFKAILLLFLFSKSICGQNASKTTEKVLHPIDLPKTKIESQSEIQQTDKKQNGTPIIYSPTTHYNFGQKDNSGVIEYGFPIHNKGDATLKINNIRAHCGCTTTKLDQKEIKPGESIILESKLSLKKRLGKQKKQITVYSNDPKNPRYALFIEGEATAKVEIRPYSISFYSREKNEINRTVRLHSNEDSPFIIESLVCDSQYFSTTIKTLKKDKTYQINIKATPLEVAGIHHSALKITTNHPQYKMIEVPITYRMIGAIMASPTEIKLRSSTTSRNNLARVYLTLSSEKRKPFSISKINFPMEDVKKTITDMGNGRIRILFENVPIQKELNNKYIDISFEATDLEPLKIPIRIINK